MIDIWPCSADGAAILAHRGGASLGAANSTDAVVLAVAAGADAVELDLQELGDGTLVITHDGGIWTDGQRAMLRDMDLARFVALSNGPAVLLQTMIDLLAALPTGLYLDVKRVTVPGLLRAIDAVSASAIAGRTVIGSFDLTVAGTVAEDGRLPASVLYRDTSFDPLELAERTGCSMVHPCFDDEPWMVGQLAGGWMERVHAAGLAVVGWNSNDSALLAEMVAAGFDALCTDDPRVSTSAG